MHHSSSVWVTSHESGVPFSHEACAAMTSWLLGTRNVAMGVIVDGEVFPGVKFGSSSDRTEGRLKEGRAKYSMWCDYKLLVILEESQIASRPNRMCQYS